MKYFVDNNNEHWVFEDDVEQEVFDNLEADNNITLTSITKAEHEELLTPSLENAKSAYIMQIAVAFEQATLAPVTVDGVDYNGAYIDNGKYKAAYDYAELAGNNTVGFRDTDYVKHTLTLAEAKAVLLAIGADYASKDEIQDDLIAQVNAATTNAEVDAIVISF